MGSARAKGQLTAMGFLNVMDAGTPDRVLEALGDQMERMPGAVV